MTYPLDTIIHLRTLVLILGETHHAGWWQSQFLSIAGLSFLERIYPRSKFSSAVRSASRGAMIVHDEKIGKGNVFHLFRLPRTVEDEVDTLLDQRSAEFEVIYSVILSDQNSLLQSLSLLVDPNIIFKEITGPIQVSSPPSNGFADMASIYLAAFRQGAQVYPYFDS